MCCVMSCCYPAYGMRWRHHHASHQWLGTMSSPWSACLCDTVGRLKPVTPAIGTVCLSTHGDCLHVSAFRCFSACGGQAHQGHQGVGEHGAQRGDRQRHHHRQIRPGPLHLPGSCTIYWGTDLNKVFATSSAWGQCRPMQPLKGRGGCAKSCCVYEDHPMHGGSQSITCHHQSYTGKLQPCFQIAIRMLRRREAIGQRHWDVPRCA